MAKGKRRAFTKEFKAQAVRIVRESGKAVGTVAREAGIGMVNKGAVSTLPASPQ